MEGYNVNINNGFPPVLPKKLGDILYFDSDDGYKYLLMNLGAKKSTELDENGFTKEQSARLSKRIEEMNDGKSVTMTLEEFDLWSKQHGII
jgi:hypothetical protein